MWLMKTLLTSGCTNQREQVNIRKSRNPLSIFILAGLSANILTKRTISILYGERAWLVGSASSIGITPSHSTEIVGIVNVKPYNQLGIDRFIVLLVATDLLCIY